MFLIVVPALANRLQELVEGARQLALDLDVSNPTGLVPLLQLLNLIGVRIERVVIDEYRVPFDVAWIREA